MSFVKTYIHPLKKPRLLVTYLSLLVGLIAQGYLFVYLAIDLAKSGFWAVVTYYESWMGVGGFIFFPLLFLIFKHWGRTALCCAAVVLQIAGIILFTTQGDGAATSPFIIGLTIACFGAGYWQMHHLNIAGHTSGHTRGFEVSLAKVVGQIGGIVGSALAGFSFIGPHHGAPMMTTALVFMLLATAGLGWTMPKLRNTAVDDVHDDGIIIENFWSVLKSHPRQNLGTACEAAYEVFMSLIMPAWMTLVGLSGFVIGLTKAFQAALTAMFAPLAGHFIHMGQGREFRLAAISGAVGCLPLLAAVSAASAAIATSFWAISRLMFMTGLESRWYARRSITQILTREIVLTATRVPSIPLVAWVAFNAPQAYMLIGIVLSLAVWPVGQWLMSCKRESALH